MPILLELCRCFGHGLKMCIQVLKFPQINSYCFFKDVNSDIFQPQRCHDVQKYTILLKILHVQMPLSEDMNVSRIKFSEF